MGMIANYVRVSNVELENYRTDSSLFEERIDSDELVNDKNIIEVDKAWEGIFYLLTGHMLETADEVATPLRWILAAPQELDPEQDLGYGPALYTTIEQTKDISNALQSISESELRNKFNGNEMMEKEVYPTIWDDEESLDYIMENLILLKDFYKKAAEENQAIIFYVC